MAMTTLTNPRFQGAMRAVFWLALAFALFMALSPQPPVIVPEQLGDKVLHMLAFAVLTVLANFAYPKASPWRLAERLCFLGALIEVVQSIPALGRTCQFSDFAADVVVVLAITAIIALIRWPRD